MEILATNYDYSGFVLGIILAIGTVIALIVTIITREWGAIPFVILFGLLSAIMYFGVGVDVSYPAIITDFNEVYEQGYEIVEQNGKIVTLRKVGE